MSDLISRQAAIDAYGDWYVEEGTADGLIGTVKQLLEGLPSAEPERKTGLWIPKDDGRYHCSSCNGIAPKGYRWDFCPNCGADMREREGER